MSELKCQICHCGGHQAENCMYIRNNNIQEKAFFPPLEKAIEIPVGVLSQDHYTVLVMIGETCVLLKIKKNYGDKIGFRIHTILEKMQKNFKENYSKMRLKNNLGDKLTILKEYAAKKKFKLPKKSHENFGTIDMREPSNNDNILQFTFYHQFQVVSEVQKEKRKIKYEYEYGSEEPEPVIYYSMQNCADWIWEVRTLTCNFHIKKQRQNYFLLCRKYNPEFSEIPLGIFKIIYKMCL